MQANESPIHRLLEVYAEETRLMRDENSAMRNLERVYLDEIAPHPDLVLTLWQQLKQHPYGRQQLAYHLVMIILWDVIHTQEKQNA